MRKKQADGTTHLREKFETGSPDYYWLNNIVAIGILTSGDGYVVIDTWQVSLFAMNIPGLREPVKEGPLWVPIKLYD